MTSSKQQAPLYVAVIADMVSSREMAGTRRASIQVKFGKAVEELNRRFRTALRSQFVVTLGDEFQGLLKDPSVVPDIIWELGRIRHLPKFRLGIGCGQIDTRIPQKAINLDGPAFHAARAAIQRAKSEELLGGVFLGFGDEVDVIANGIARLLQFHLDRRSEKQLEVMQFLRMGSSQVQIAAKLGLSSQVVNKRKKPVGWEAFKAGEEALKESLLLGVARVTR